MNQIFKFEWKKLWRKKRLFMLLFLVVFIISAMYYNNYSKQEEVLLKDSSVIYEYNYEASSLLRAYQDLLESEPENLNYTRLYENAMKMNISTMTIQRAYSQGDVENIPNLELEFIEAVEDHWNLGGEFKLISEKELDLWKHKTKILVNKDLPYDSDTYPITTGNFTKSMLGLFLGIVGVFIFIFFFSDILCSEFEGYTIKTLLTQPIKKWKIVFSKFLVTFIYAWVWAFMILTSSFLIPYFILDDYESLQYPHLITMNIDYQFVDTSTVVIQLLILFLGVSIFTISNLLLASAIFKNRFMTILFMFLYYTGGSLITRKFNWLQGSWNPFLYLDSLTYIENPGERGILFPLLVLISYSLICILVTNMILLKNRLFHSYSMKQKPFRNGKIYRKIWPIYAFILFEARKALRRGHIKALSIILLLSLTVGYVYVTVETKQKEQSFLESLDNTSDYLQEQLIPLFEVQVQSFQQEVKNLEDQNLPEGDLTLDYTKEKLMYYQQLLDEEKADVKRLEDMLFAYEQNDWSTFYDYWILENRLWNGEITRLKEYTPNYTNFTFMASIEEKKWLSQNKIEPIPSPEILFTIFEEHEDKGNHQKFDNTGLYSLFLFYDSYVYLGLIAILLFLFSSGFAAEHGKSRTIGLLKTQPLSHSSLLTGKLVVSTFISWAIFLCASIFILIIGTVYNRFGDWLYPVLHYDSLQKASSMDYNGYITNEGAFHFIPMGEYILHSSLLAICMLIFLFSIAISLSVYIYSEILVFFTTLTIAISGYILTTNGKLAEYAHFIPFSYLDIGKVVNGEIGFVLKNDLVHPVLGIAMLTISSAVILAVSIFPRSIISKLNVNKEKKLSR